MEIYLPIAEMSVHWLIIFGMGAAVGFLSGLFGVGGGFLLTPLLIFYGIPSVVAVGTTSTHITASTMSGALTHWKKNAIDFKMGLVMLVGGIAGTFSGVQLFVLLRKAGQVDLTVSLAYVILLGVVGGLMLNESVRTLLARRAGQAIPARRSGQHRWIHGWPLKMRFRESRLYISAIPPILIGFVVGMLAAIMGVGGAFVLVPAMIYILRMPTNIVLGTSMFQVVFVSAVTTVLQATNNYSIDIMLAFFLILGGVTGAQFGVRASARLRGEELRLLLGLLVAATAMRLLVGLVARPIDVYTVTTLHP